ncbi:MAG: hypothetical protein ACSHWS_05990 [Sulfitobacter sp.]
MPSKKLHKAAESGVPRRAIVVLGMHRSGTSALTGILEIMGAQTPKNQLKVAADNPRGFFEAAHVKDLNDRLLAANNLTWDTWSSLPDDPGPIPQGMLSEAVEILADEFGKAPLIALKDPRLCRLMPFWIQVFEQWRVKPLALVIVRNPLEVAESLHTRNNFDLSNGILLWMIYILQSEADTRGMPRAFTHFDLVMGDPVQVIEGVQETLKPEFPKTIRASRKKIEKFVSPDLRHHAQTDIQNLPEMVQSVYRTVTGWIENGETAQDYETLDHIKRQFQALLEREAEAETLYQAMYHMDQTSTKNRVLGGSGKGEPVPEALYKALSRAHEITKSELDRETKQVSELSKSLEDAKKALTDAQANVQGRNQELVTLTQLYLDTENALTAAQDALAKAQTGRDVAQAQFSDLQAEHKKLQQNHAHTSDENTELHALVARVETERARLDGENTELHALVARVENERARLDGENTELHALVARVENERQVLINSTTWRATRPLRSMMSVFRRRG